MKIPRLFLTIPAFAPALLLAAAPASARDWGNVAGWYVNSGSNSCGMYAQDRGGKGTEVVILKRLDGNIYIQANNLGWSIPPGGEARARYHIDGADYNGIMNGAALAAYPGRGLLAAFDDAIEERLRKGSMLTIRSDGRDIVEIPLDGSATAFATIESCLDELRVGGGEAASSPPTEIAAGFASLAVAAARPRNDPGSWFQASDYPGGNHAREGTSSFQLLIGTDGDVEDCKITQSSGDASLDSATCRAASRRARFYPAKDAQGNPVTGSYESKVSWKAPG